MKTHRKVSQLDEFEIYTPSPEALARARKHRYEPMETLSGQMRALSWICRIIAAAIMIETLFFKFTGSPESVYIFSRMHLEPWWRYGQGIWELAAALLLLTPRLGWAGGLLTLGAIGAAIVSHLTVLGIEVQGDHGLLFGMAVVTFVCGFVVTILHRREIPSYAPMTPW
jgi:hypothetical protein